MQYGVLLTVRRNPVISMYYALCYVSGQPSESRLGEEVGKVLVLYSTVQSAQKCKYSTVRTGAHGKHTVSTECISEYIYSTFILTLYRPSSTYTYCAMPKEALHRRPSFPPRHLQ